MDNRAVFQDNSASSMKSELEMAFKLISSSNMNYSGTTTTTILKIVSLVSGDIIARVRTAKKPMNKPPHQRFWCGGKTEIEQSLARSQSMLRIVEDVRTVIMNAGEIYVPDLTRFRTELSS